MHKIILLLFICINLSLSAQSPFDVKTKKQSENPTKPSVAMSIDGQDKTVVGNTAFVPMPSVDYPTKSTKVEMVHAPKTGMPILIKSEAQAAYKSLNSEQAVTKVTYGFLTEIQEYLCIDQAAQEFQIAKQKTEESGHHHIRLQQHYEAIPVYGADLTVHISPEGKMTMMGRSQPSPSTLNLSSNISIDDARASAIEDVQQYTTYVEMTEEQKDMLHYHEPINELVIYPDPNIFGAFKLAHHLTVRPNFMDRYEYFVDAHTGEVIHSFNHTCSLVPVDGPATTTATDLNGVSRTINTYEYQGNFYLFDASRTMYTGTLTGLPMPGDGGIETYDFQNNSASTPGGYTDISNTNNNYNQSQFRIGVTAHYNAGECYEYFRQTHNRNSINGQGGDILSFVNVADEDGNGMDNAFWNGEYMFYGSGNTAFQPLAGALDVAGHEMSHGVIQNTANLIYEGESGAINEHIADVFGVMIDRDDWQLGEDITNSSAFPTGFLRDMQNPNNGGNNLGDAGWQPDHMDDAYTGSQDNGGVHINSGILNRAFFLMASQIGKEKAETIYFKALEDYLTRFSKFIDLRISVLEAAQTINGVTANDIADIESAFSQVGIGEGPATQAQEDLELNDGAESVLTLDVNEFDQNTLYISTPEGNNFVALTTTEVNRKPSITDNGEQIYFVGDDNLIHNISLENGTINESTFQSEPIWDNVAVSKDGSKLALISTSIDTSIYIFNLANEQLVKYELYNPTFTQGVTTGGVLYADAIEWDYSGEYLLYDAFNRVPSDFVDDKEYWDMGFIRVWNNASDNFGDGEITKVFTSLPEGVSVGNPTYSKNSPLIFAFDYLKANNKIDLRAVNLENNQVGTIVSNSDNLFYASYSVDDGKIAFSDENNGSDVVSTINLQANKIQASGSKTPVINVAKWPVWYATGEREFIGIETLPEVVEALTVVPNPFEEDLMVCFSLKEPTALTVSVIDITGKTIQELPSQLYSIGENQMAIAGNDLPMGTYMVKLKGASFSKTIKVVKI